VHRVLLPKTDVPIPIFEDVDAVAVADAVEDFARVSVEVEETVFFLYFLVWVLGEVQRSFMCRKTSTSR
jgi:hypothetical protein